MHVCMYLSIYVCMYVCMYHVLETHGQDGWGDIHIQIHIHIHTHTYAQMILSGCWLWLYVGVVLLALPLCFFAFSLYICRKLFSSGSFKYTPTPRLSIKEIYRKSTQATGCLAKVSTFLVAVLDIRFKGDWGKLSPEAKTWGFLLANTGPLWFCFAFPLLIKVVTAIASNVPDPKTNALLMLAIYCGDALSSALFRGHRDRIIDATSVITGFGNFATILALSLPVFMPPKWLPEWISGPYVIMLTSIVTGVSAVAALLDPLAGGLRSVTKGLTKVFKAFGCGAFAGPLVSLVVNLTKALKAR